MHYYKRNLGDYAKKAGRLSMLQHGSYTLLIDACYDREQFPTLEEAIEWTWASNTEEIEAVTFVLRKFFTLENGVYIQNRIKEEIDEFHSKAETNKRIANERETKRKENNTNRVRTVNEKLKKDNEAPPNHKPITINHKPIKNITPLAMLVSMGIDESLAKDWLAVRKLKKSAPTQTAFNAIKKHAESHGYTFLQAVEISVSKSWSGFDVSWLQQEMTNSQSITNAASSVFKEKYIKEQTQQPLEVEHEPVKQIA